MQIRNLPCKFGSYLALLHHLKQMPRFHPPPVGRNAAPVGGQSLLTTTPRRALYLPSAHVRVYFGGAFAAHFYDYLLCCDYVLGRLRKGLISLHSCMRLARLSLRRTGKLAG
jgi:hypothetical protein